MISKLARPGGHFPRLGIWLGVATAFWTGPAGAADVQRGNSLYSTHCAVCHGSNGTPVIPGAPNFRRMEGLMRPDMQLMTAIRSGKGAMPGYFGVLRDREILDVVAYLRTLS